MSRRDMLHALGIPGDVRDGLTRRLGASEVDEVRIRCNGEVGAGTPGRWWTKSAAAFVLQLEALDGNDEVWEFRSPPETWSSLSGRAGLCVLRGDEVLAIHITLLS